MHSLVRNTERSKHFTPNRQMNQTCQSALKGGVKYMRKHLLIGVAGVALLAACAKPIASADYPADKKKYDDCVAREKDRVAGAQSPAYYRDTIRNFCGDPPIPPKSDQK